ncbi:endothelin-converting enzyme 1-like isoform X1 [Stegodyphus dumicola]|uniref:endothelin-converting enzyme 1-like isoform X1 n=1 Tax=Stegodyphus dumicola TaxID=202533 RepID=UPI0015B377BB|nr:endothelin-converting enzyme 1-like isoform X1 [Stegodyphus dumicola]
MPQVSWLHYFKSILKIDVNASEPFIISNLNFLKEVIGLINQTDKRVLANYIMWRLVHESLPLLAPRYSSTKKLMPWEKIITPRWRYCISVLNESLGMALRFSYVRHYIGDKTSAFTKVLNLTSYIRDAYKTILQQLSPYIYTSTMQEAIGKADSVRFDILYKKELLNETYVSQMYENLSVINLNHFENVLSIRRWSTDRYLSQLRSSTKIDDLKQHAISIPMERFYNSEKNEIVLNAELFQAPFFRSDVQNYLNFGGIGSMIGREFARAFDKRGRQGWWSDISGSDNIEDRGQCIIQQYNDYIMNSTEYNDDAELIIINESETRNNILTDIYGLKAAYMGYNEWVNENGMEQLKPFALAQFTSKQLFWIRAANILCESATDPHPTGSRYPQKFRVMGPLFSLPEFAQDFNCSQGEVMNRGEDICIPN